MQQPEYEQIARLAYELYLDRGAEEGLALDDWLAAERELTKPGRRASSKHVSRRRKTR